MQPQRHQASNPAQTAGIVLCVCALLVAVGMFTKGWGTATEGRTEISAGLFSIEGCESDGSCESLQWDYASKRLDIPSDVDTFRLLGMLAGFAALAGLLLAGVMALAQNTNKIPITMIQLSLGLAAGLLTYFTIRMMMSDRDVSLSPSYSAFLTIGGLIAGGTVLKQWIQPIVNRANVFYPQPGYLPPPPPPPQPQYACRSCNTPLQWVQQYQRWHCSSCQQYV